MTIESWGTGRKDYSQNIEASVVPIVRSYQVNAAALEPFTLTAGEQKDVTVDLGLTGSQQSHFIAQMDVSVDANVLISIEIISGKQTFIREYGYQSVSIIIPQTLGLSEITLRIKNYSDISVNGLYSHNGVTGTEKMMPTPD